LIGPGCLLLVLSSIRPICNPNFSFIGRAEKNNRPGRLLKNQFIGYQFHYQSNNTRWLSIYLIISLTIVNYVHKGQFSNKSPVLLPLQGRVGYKIFKNNLLVVLFFVLLFKFKKKTCLKMLRLITYLDKIPNHHPSKVIKFF
jgi:hypothetical protein